MPPHPLVVVDLVAETAKEVGRQRNYTTGRSRPNSLSGRPRTTFGGGPIQSSVSATAHHKVQVMAPPAAVVQPHPDIMRLLLAIIRATRIFVARDMTQLHCCRPELTVARGH